MFLYTLKFVLSRSAFVLDVYTKDKIRAIHRRNICHGVSLDTQICAVTYNICLAAMNLFFRDTETAVYA